MSDKIQIKLKCKQCNEILEPDAQFCHACGTKMSIPLLCPSCCRSIEADWTICPKCQKTLTAERRSIGLSWQSKVAIGAAFALITIFLWTAFFKKKEVIPLPVPAPPAVKETNTEGKSLSGLSNGGKVYWESTSCAGIKADLIINHRTVAQPTLFLNGHAIKLEDGPEYSGPYCVNFRGVSKVGFIESSGNAIEIYRIIDLDTYAISEITYEQAKKIGFQIM